MHIDYTFGQFVNLSMILMEFIEKNDISPDDFDNFVIRMHPVKPDNTVSFDVGTNRKDFIDRFNDGLKGKN